MEEFIELWDEAHYLQKEVEINQPLTPLVRFRIRKRSVSKGGWLLCMSHKLSLVYTLQLKYNIMRGVCKDKHDKGLAEAER